MAPKTAWHILRKLVDDAATYSASLERG